MRARGSRLAALGLLVTTAAALGRSGGGYYGSLGAGSCPEACEVAGDNPSNWTQYHDIDRLLSCNRKPKLLDFTLHTLLEDGKQNVIRACSTFRGEEVEQEVVETAIDIKNGAGVAELSSDVETTISLQMARVKATRPVIAEQIITAAKEVQVSLLNETTSSKSTVLFAHYGDSVVGVYVGGRIRNRGVALTAVQRFIDHLDKEEFAKASQTFLIQLCGKGIDADYVLGVIGDTTPGMAGLSIVQRAVKSWSEAKCVTNMGESGSFGAAKIWLADNRMPPKAFSVTANGLQTMKSGDTQVKTVTPVINNLHPRADCRTIQVVSGDSCASLATKCGISGSDLTKFNPSPTFCSTLRVGQHICCSSGTLPDLTPKPNPDGSCASYLVQSGDWCDKIATSNGLTVDDIEFFNRKTWGWSGCKRLFAGSRICLSRGDPPMPEPITNAVCGPQKPGTPEPPKGTKLADLNPCPLKACCNIWGQCGITEDFCIESSLGPPGTSEPGKNGCISNCGVDIVNNGSGPKEYMSVGYFEAFNGNRPCLHMHVEDVGTSVTHIHFSFADVNENFEVSVAAVQTQWDRFINKKFKAKRILAFGGWASSTGPTYWIFREGVKPQNRERLATNMANFIKKHDLDGIDLDWEYPGAPDIPGVPPAEPIDGPNYLELLKLIRQKLPDKSLSIAAPASYWYLKAFPIDKIADVVDYIIYMTYDLHGQWDYDNSYSSPGCPKGDCLRSHVNITETYTALSMITKAGVPSNKIVVGVSSYGRSFRMLEAGCTGPMCRFTGPTSGATRGRCTNEAGYVSNAEIDEILKKNPSAKKFSDDSGSNILVYDNLQWVAYMDDKNKDSRMQRWKGLNFAGITDWAVDLKAFQRYEPPDVPPVDKSRNWREIDCLHVAVTDTSLNSQYRWEAVRADQAWEEGLKSYRKSGTTQDFSIYMADFYDAAEGKYCSKLSEGNGCERLEKCIMTRDSGPAGTFIMNSFSYAYIALNNVYEGWNAAREAVGTDIDDIEKEFSAVKPDLFVNILFNLLNAALGTFLGPVFNNVLKPVTFFKNSLDNLKDSSYFWLTAGVSTGKDLVNSGALNKEATSVKSVLHNAVDNWQKILSETASRIFDGDEKGIKFLTELIAKGKLLDAGIEGREEIKARNIRTLYAFIIPVVWSLDNPGPVVIDVGTSCDDVGVGNYKWITPKDAEATSACVDNKQYYLVRTTGLSHDLPSNPNYPTRINKFKPPPGLNKLKDRGDFTVEEIVRGALASHKKYGLKESDEYYDLGDEATFNDLFEFFNNDNAALAPGVIRIPVCSPDDAFDGWKRKTVGQKLWPSYPCGKLSETRMLGKH